MLHDEEQDALCLYHFVQLDDVGVMELLQDVNLPPNQRTGLYRKLSFADDLDCNLAQLVSSRSKMRRYVAEGR